MRRLSSKDTLTFEMAADGYVTFRRRNADGKSHFHFCGGHDEAVLWLRDWLTQRKVYSEAQKRALEATWGKHKT